MANNLELKKTYRQTLLVTAVVLLFVGIGFYVTDNFGAYRFMRGVVSLTFLVIVLRFKKQEANPNLMLFMILSAISSVATVWYENTTIATASLFVNFLAYTVLIKAVWSKVTFKNVGAGLLAIFLLLVSCIAYLLYEFVLLLKGFAGGDFHYATMLIGAMALVLLSFLSLLYNHTCNTSASLVFLISVLLFAFAEIFRAIAYYDFGFGNIPVYVARVLLIAASGLLAYFMWMDKSPKEELSGKLLW